MRITCTLFLLVLLSGCSFNAELPPVAEQTHDLFDTDGDGVINARDKCAGTPSGAVINNDGCPTYIDTVTEAKLQVLFANDSTVIPATFFPDIMGLAVFMKGHPNTSVTLHGHASQVGPADRNHFLSEGRAEAVKRQLVRDGVSPSRINNTAYGDREPVTASTEEESHILSRRVVANVSATQSDVLEKWTIYSSRDK